MSRNNFYWITFLAACYSLWPVSLQAFGNYPDSRNWSIQSTNSQDEAAPILRQTRLPINRLDNSIYFPNQKYFNSDLSRAYLNRAEFKHYPQERIIRPINNAFHPTNKSGLVQITQSFSIGLNPNYQLAQVAQENYQRFSAGTGRIANRAAIQVENRSGSDYRSWSNPTSSLPARYELRTNTNHPLEIFAFTEMNPSVKLSLKNFGVLETRILNSRIAEARRLPLDATALPRSAALVTLSSAARGETTTQIGAHDATSEILNSMSQFRVQLDWVPDGFITVQSNNSSSSMIANDTLAVEMLSDGLALFSVFVQPENASAPRDRWSAGDSFKRGTTMIVRKEIPELKVIMTLVGEVPMLTAYKVLEAAKVEILSKPSS